MLEDRSNILNSIPNDIQAEQAVLGSIFLNEDALSDAMRFIGPKDFYNHANGIIFEAMISLDNSNERIDALTLSNKLKKNKQLKEIGGVGYLNDLVNNIPTSSHVEEYSKIIRDKSYLRKLIKTARDIISDAQDESAPTSEILERAENKLTNILNTGDNIDFNPIDKILNQSLDEIQKLSVDGEKIIGISTGYNDFDEMISGLQPDNLIILAARPSVGKTALALNIAQNIGTSTDKNIAIFSLEMSAKSLVNRMICAEGMINANHLKNGNLNKEEWNKLALAVGQLSNANIFIDDTPGIKMSEIRSKCKKLYKEKKGLGLIVIDYLQLVEGSGRENRQQEVSDISRKLKKLAKELDVPIIALSQLSRGVEQRQDKRPILSDIRESGSIEQDADIVAFLYRKDYYERGDNSGFSNQDNGDASPVELIVEKNRSGARGIINLLFIKSYNKFVNMSKREI